MTVPVIYSSTALTVAEDAAYDAQSDAYDGTPVQVEPSAGALAQGLHRPGRQVAAQHINWLEGQFAAILSQLIVDTAVQDGRLDVDEAELLDHEGRITVAESWIANNSPRLRIYEYLASGTFIVPPRVVTAMAFGCGGGGAGGAGVAGTVTVDVWRPGAGGGGGAIASYQPIGGCGGAPALVPGSTLNVIVGGGGAASGTLGATGGNGGDSYIQAGATVYALWHGAQGGRGAVGGPEPVDYVHYSMGGCAVRDTPIMIVGPAGQGIRIYVGAATLFGAGANAQSFYLVMQPAQGGFGAGGSTHPAGGAGAKNPIGNYVGGGPGQYMSDGDWDSGVPLGTNLTRRAGGPGGGGGAGPFGNGGGGGNGQIGHDAGAQSSLVQTSGFQPAANSGAGGGGAGSGSYEDDIVNVGANNDCLGANGGSGRVYIITVEESP